MNYEIWLNGDYILRDEAKISMLDRGFRLGDVVFDTSRTFNGKIFKLRDHIDRLFRSLQYLRIDPGLTISEMERITEGVVDRNEPVRKEANDDYMITQIVTRGTLSGSSPNVSVWIDPIEYAKYKPIHEKGGHVVIPKTRSYSSSQIDPKIKHYSRLNMVLAEMETTDVDPEAFPLMLDLDGNLSETNGANVFLVTDGVLRTTSDNAILQGISRQVIMELADQLGIPTVEEDLQPYDLYTADEALICSTPHCLLPIGLADNRQIGDKAPGPITKQLLAAWSEKVGVDIVDQVNERALWLETHAW